MVKKRNSFAKMGVVFVALLVALGFIGTSQGYWSEMLYIIGTVETYTLSSELTCDGRSPSPPDTTWISYDVDDPSVVPHVLEVTVHKAEVGTEYSCEFHIYNSGTIPVKIEGIVVSDLPEEVDLAITVEGEPIDPGQTNDGIVQVSLTPPEPPEEPNPNQGDTFTFTLTISVVQWNQ